MKNLLVSNAFYADAAVILIMLIFISAGVSRGFIKSILSFFGTLAALIFAFLLCKKFAFFLDDKFSLLSKLAQTVEGFLLKNSKFAIVISGENIESSLSAAGIPGFMAALIKKLPVVAENTYPAGTTLASLTAPVLANYLLLLISFLCLFILFKVVLIILKRAADSIKKIKILDSADRILGFAVGAIEGFILIYVLFTVLSVFPSLFAKPLSAVKESTVAGYLYESDILGKALERLIDKDKLNNNINDFIKDKKETPEEESRIFIFGGHIFS